VVVGAEPGELEPGAGYETVDGAVEVAAAEDAAIERIAPGLAAGHLRVRREAVLDEVQRAAGAEHAADLGQGRAHVGDRAQGPGAEDVVDASVVQGQRLGVQADVFDRHRARGDSLGRQFPPGGGGIDGPDVGQAGRVMGHVAARAEADLEHVAAQPAGDAGAQPAEVGTGHDEVDAPGKDLAFVKAHGCQCCRQSVRRATYCFARDFDPGRAAHRRTPRRYLPSPPRRGRDREVEGAGRHDQ
jgi:hypothetical protein